MPSLLQATLHQAHCKPVHPQAVDQQHGFA
jgi:hypothetical protein